jgi:transposase
MNVIGIDVSKTALDCFFSASGQSARYCNSAQGFGKLLKALEPSCLVILEASGGYERALVQSLHQARVSLSVVNPKRVRDFAKGLGKLAKTDGLDAKVLAQFGKAVSVRLQDPPLPQVETLKRLNSHRQDIQHSLIQFANRAKQADCPFIQESLRQIRQSLLGQCKETERQIAQLIKQTPALQGKAHILTEVVGVGQVMTAMLLGDLPELGQVSAKEIAALVGVAPFNCDSGQFRGQRKIWGGRREVRNVLYMAANRARIHDPEMKAYYEQLRTRGKAFKVALVACMRKLLVRLNAKMRDFLQQPENA